MTLIVGLISEGAAVLGVDGRRFARGGGYETDQATKVFRVGTYAFAISGQLAPDDREFSDLFLELLKPLRRGRLEQALQLIEQCTIETLRAVSEELVAFHNRVTEVALIGLSGYNLRGAHIRVWPEGPQLLSRISRAKAGEWILAGDSSAIDAVKPVLTRGPSCKKSGRQALQDRVVEMLRAGVRASPHRCGGALQVVALTERECRAVA